ncbi:MAG: GAF domain-containing protein, partial [Chloroflexi bacterium]|nr:GAF domain-containing protein [Chloroflexota bacterium]
MSITPPRPDRILVVDDSAVIRRLLCDVLQADGYEMLAAQDGLEAVALALEHRPDLVVLDVNLPGQDGYAVCRQVRAHPDTQHTPVLFVSAAHPDVSDRVRGLEAGGNDYLASPFASEELLARVRALLRIKRNEDELRLRQYGLESLNRQLLALQAASAQVVSTLDLDVLVHRVTEALVQNLGYQCAVLALIQEPGSQLTLTSIRGVPIDLLDHIESETGRDMTRPMSSLDQLDPAVLQMFQQGRVLDAAQIIQGLGFLGLSHIWDIFQQHMGLGDMLLVPLLVQDQLIGGLWAAVQHPTLAPIDVDILRILADQVAVAIYNARLHANAVVAQEQASLLLDIQSAIAARFELQPILMLVLGGAVRALEATSGLLALRTPPDQGIVVQTSYGLPPGADVAYLRGVTDGVLGQAIATGRSMQIDHVHNLESDAWAHELGLRAMVIVPIQLAKRVIGVLSVHDRSGGRPFTLQDEQLLGAITDQAAVAIEQARLYEEVRRRAQEQAALNLVAETANRSLELSEILEASLQRVLDVNGLPCGMVYLPDITGEQLIMVAHQGTTAGLLHQAVVARLNVDPAQDAFRTGRAVVINLGATGRSRPGEYWGRPVSLAVIPLQAKDVTLGVMEVGGLEPELVSEQDLPLLTAIGRQVGVAVENAQLYAETQQRVRELAALNQMATAVGESLDLDTVLGQALEHIQKLTNAQHLIVYLSEHDNAPLRQRATWGLPGPQEPDSWVPATDLFGESSIYEVTTLNIVPGS